MTNVESGVGLLIIGRKRPGFDQEWNGVMRQRGTEAILSLGYRVVGGDEPVVDDQSILVALGKIRAAGCESLVVLQPSLGNGQLAMTVARNWEGPVVLFATPERQTGDKVSSCSLVATHLWASVMRQANHPFELVVGDPAEKVVRESLRDAILISRTHQKIRRAKVGLVGSHAPGFVDMAADPFVLAGCLGTQLHSLSLAQFIERCKSVSEGEVARDLELVRGLGLPMKGVTVESLGANSRYYLAIRELMVEEGLDGIAIQCWPELSNLVGHWPYLAFTRLTSEGAALAMEGDTDAAVLALMGKELGLGVGFITDWLEHTARRITFWHAGVAPFPMCYPVGSEEGPYITTHFNIEKPAVVDGALRRDMPVTIARLWRCDGEYHLTSFHGRTVRPGRFLTGNTAWVEVEDGAEVPARFDTLCHAGMPHHVTVFEGERTSRLKRLARSLSIQWVETD